MADPVTIAAIASATASVAAGGVKSAEGFSRASIMKAEAASFEQQARVQQLQASQIRGNQQNEINDVMARVNAVRVGRGVGLDSATGRAIRRDRKQRAFELKNARQYEALFARDQSRGQARNLKKQAQVAPIVGFASALPDFVSAAKGFADMGQK